MRTYVVNVPKLRFGKGKDDVALKDDTIELSDKAAEKLLKKAYIKFETATKRKAATPDNKKNEEPSDGKADGKDSKEVNIAFNPDEVIDKNSKKAGK